MPLLDEAKKFAVVKYGPDQLTGYPHAMRVSVNAKDLAKLHGADAEIVELAAIFHDISLDGRNIATHAVESANICDTFLRDNRCPAEKRERIIAIIRKHTIRDWTMQGAPATTEEKILFDAEALERITMHGLMRFITMAFRLPYNSTKEVIKATEKFMDENYNSMFFDESKNKAQENYLLVKNAIARIKEELDIR